MSRLLPRPEVYQKARLSNSDYRGGPKRKFECDTLPRVPRPVVAPYLIAACVVVSFVQSCFLAHAMVPDIDETVHVFLGRAAITGEISLFQDELPGFRAPLPFYFFGLSQLLFDRSIVAARIFSAAIGSLCLVLLLLLATRIGGPLCGLLTFLFAITQSVIIGYFAQSSYHALASLVLLAVLYVALCTSLPYKNVLAMAFCSLFFFIRTLMMPLIPLAMIYLLAKAKGRGERLAIVAAAVVPPLVFFLYDPHHLKLLAYVPVLEALVRPLGYQSSPRITATLRYDPANTPMAALILLARWYKAWIVAGVVLAAAIVGLAVRGHSVKAFVSNWKINLIAVVFLYIALIHLAGARGSWTGSVGYIPSFGVLAAVLLGFGFSVVIAEYCVRQASRRAVLLFLTGVFLFAPALSRPAALPRAVSLRDSPTRATRNLADALGILIPSGSHVFHLGASQALYMAGREPYLRQAFGFLTLSPLTDDRVRLRSGLWGEAEIRQWLITDADYAVVVPESLDDYRITCPSCMSVAESLLARHFRQVAVLTQYPGLTHIVYKRITSS
jgi:hypothetical protein